MNSTYNVLISADLLNPTILPWDTCFNLNFKAKNPQSINIFSSFLLLLFEKYFHILKSKNPNSVWVSLTFPVLGGNITDLSLGSFYLVYTKTKEFAFLLSLCNQINWSKKTSSAANEKYNERRCPTFGCSGFCKKYFLNDRWILCVLKISLTFNFSP